MSWFHYLCCGIWYSDTVALNKHRSEYEEHE